jgi:tape measure domain-containing protein
MAKDVELMILQMSADLRRLDKGVSEGQKRFDRRLSEMERRAMANDKKLSAIFANSGRNITASFQDGLRGLAPALAAAFSVGAVVRYADAYTGLKNSLAAAGLEGARLTKVEDALYDAANRNGVAVEATAQLFQRAAFARDKLGASDETLTRFVSGTTAALKLQGTSAEAASGPLLQLGQAISGNVVQAEEYNSLIDGLPVILQAAAAGSARFGGDVSKLTAEVKAGKVGSKEFFDAILAGLPAIEERASRAQTTVAAALQTLNNELGRFVGQTDSGLSATQRMAQGIVALSENLDTIALVVAAVATVMGGRFVLSMTAGSGAMIANGIAAVRLSAFQTAMTASMTNTTRATLLATGATRAFSAALMANPIGAVILAVSALAAAMVYLNNRFGESAVASRRLEAASKASDQALQAYEEAAIAAANATAKDREEKDRAAASTLAAARASVANTQAIYAETAALAARRAELAQQAAANAGRGIGNPYAPGFEQGQADLASRRATAAAAAAKAAADAEKANLDRIIANAESGAYRTAPGSAPATTAKGSGTDAARMQSRREELDLEREIAAARAKGDEAAIKALEERQRLNQLTASYEDAGYAEARATAVEHLGYENEAAALAERRALAQRSITTLAEGAAAAVEAMVLAEERAADAALERLAFEVEIARLSGDVRLPALERELWINERINDLLGDRAALASPEEKAAARGQAEGEADALRAADIIGGLGIADPGGDAVAARQAAYDEIERLRQQDQLSDQQAAQARAQADADYWEQRTSRTRSALDTLAGLQNSSNKRLAQIGKAAAVAQATIDGVLAIQKAWASAPYPFNLPAVAVTTAMTAANVASIAGMADGGLVTGPGGPREDKVLRRLSAGEFVVNARATRENRALLEGINQGRVPGMAGGGMVGRVSAAADRLPGLAASRTGNQTFSTTIDARSADLGVERRLRAVLAERDAALAGQVRGIVARTDKYALGRRRK